MGAQARVVWQDALEPGFLAALLHALLGDRYGIAELPAGPSDHKPHPRTSVQGY